MALTQGFAGAGGGGGGGAVTVADGSDVTEGMTTDGAVQGDNPGTVSAKLRGLNKSIATGLTVTSAALPTGAATDATLTTTNTEIGPTTETAPANDTAASGLNGRLQRVAQRLTSLIGLLPAALVGGRLDINVGAAGAGVKVGATVAAGDNATEGNTTDTAVTGDNAGTLSAKLRGLNKILFNVWNSAVGYLQVGGVTAVGSPPTGNPVSVATFDGTNKQHLKGNTDGTLAVGGFSAGPSVTLTRAANVTAYSAQDEVATAGTAATSISVSRLTGGTGLLDGCRLIYSANPTVTPAFRLLIFNANVTAAGDNAALNLSTTDANKAIGVIDFTATQAGGSATSAPLIMSGAPVAPIKFTTDAVFLLLITTNGFTPISASETLKLTLGAEMN